MARIDPPRKVSILALPRETSYWASKQAEHDTIGCENLSHYIEKQCWPSCIDSSIKGPHRAIGPTWADTEHKSKTTNMI